MSHTRLVTSVAGLIVAGLVVVAAAQDRAGMVMGFDQDKTTHHFSLYTDGGAIEVSVNDPADVKNRDAIRAHLPHIAMISTRRCSCMTRRTSPARRRSRS